MADCEYQIAGDDRIYSESEFKKLLSEGYLDKVMLENQVKVRGIKPNEELAKSFQMPSAIQPAVTPTEPVTKTEEKVTEPIAEVKEEVSDDRVAEEYAKSTNSDIEAAKKSISDVEKYNNGEMSPKEYLESQGYSEENFFEVGADREIKDFSDLTEEEFKEVADRKANYANDRVNEIKQKVQAEPVTEPTAEEQDKVAEKAGITPKNFRDLYKVNRDLFGLDRIKSFTNAIAMDRMIGTMARRAGVDKSEMYGRLQFEKSTEKDLPKGVKLQVDAWHGSPYQFDKFTTEKMGTGEGAQAFGWGLYFTDLKGIAENYAKNLSLPKFDDFIDKFKKASDYSKLNNTAINNIIDFSENYDYDYDKVLDALKRNDYEGDMKDAINFLENNKNLYEKRSKNLYKVSLHKGKTPDQYTWLEWDKKITKDQIDKIIDGDIDGTIQQALYDSFIDEFMVSTPQDLKEVVLNDLELTGKELYDILSQNVYDSNDNPTPKAASIALLNAGIDGIKYPAESISRGATSDTARGFNYVVFDEDAVSIEEAVKFQKDANKARGAAMVAMDGKAVIYALTDPNVSTPMHELAHVYEHYLTDAERNKILKAAGTDTWNTKTSEYFARGFEKYLAEGKSPVESLNKVFEKFKEWLTDIYSGIKNSEIDVKLNKDMKAIYDTILKEGDTKSTTETKQPTREAVAAKNMADILRKAKIKMEGGTAMASFLPGFENVWNGSIEAVSKAIELGGITAGNFRQSIESGMKALKQTDAYKAITDPKERAKISARYKKILTSAYSEGYNIDTDNLREAEFNDFNQKLEESKDKTLSNKEFNKLKAEAKKFVNDNLPADSYKKSEVQSYVINNFDKAKTVEDIQKNLDKVNSIMTTKEAKIETAEAKQAEKDRKSAAKRIKTKVNPRGKFMSVKSGDTRKSKVSIDAQEKIDSMREQGMFEDDYLNSLNKEDTDALEAQVDEILGIGKEERKTQLKEKRTEKKTDEATILQALSKPDEILNSEDQINDRFAKNRGAVIVIKDEDGNEVSMSKGDFANYMKENPDADLTGSKFYKSKSKDMGRLKEKYTPGVLGKLRRLGMGPLRNLETYVSDLSKGSRKMRDWMSKKVDEISFASLQKLEEAYYLKRDVIKGLDKVFGTAGGFSNSDLILNQKSGIQSDAGTENATDLTNGEILDIYNLVRSEYDGKEIDPKKVERNRERVRVANQIDPDEVIRYVESNPQLKEACDFAADKFNKDYRPLFAPTYETVSGFKMPDGYYYPEPAADVSAADVMNLEDSPKAMSAMVPNLRLRKNYNGAFQVTDIREKLDNYINSMTHAKAFIPIVESMRPLFSDINRPRVLEKLGNTDKYNDLKQTLERIFAGKSAYEDQTGFDKDYGIIANFATVGALIFRPKAIAQQASAFVNYYPAGKLEGVDATDVATSVVPVTKEQRKFWLDFYRKNPYLYERLSGSNTSIDAQALQSDIDKIANDYLRGAIDMVTFLGMLSIKTGDALSVATPYGGEGFAMAHFKKRFKENGGDYEDARNYGIQQWFKQTERTQQPSKDPTAISTASQSPMVRMTMPFLSAQYSATRKAVIALKNMKDWKNLNEAEKQQARTDFLYYSTVGNIPFLIGSGTIFGIINVAQSMMSADDDEEERIANNKLKILLANTFLDRVQSDLQAFYLLGKIGGEALNKLRGRDFGADNPTLQRITKIATALEGYTRGIFNDDWNDLTAEEKANFFNRYKMSDYDVRKFEKMNEEERQQYLQDHPFIRQQIATHRIEEWNDKYSSLRADQKMGKEEWDAMMEAFNIKNVKKLKEGIDAWMEGNASFMEATYNTINDQYFKWDIKNDANILLKEFFGETPASMLTPVETVIPEEKDFNKFMKGGEGQVGGQTGGQTGGQVGGQQ